MSETEESYMRRAIELARRGAGCKAGNKGYDCAVGAIEMVNLKKML